MVILLMGVSGSGKTTVGELLAEDLGWSYHDADEFHPQASVDKMSRGEALTDDDRAPWLRAIRDCMEKLLRQDQSAVLSCSALKEAYREVLLDGLSDVRLVYLKGEHDLIRKRMEARKGHFFKAALLKSQFAALEEPTDADLTVDVALPPERIVEEIKSGLGLSGE